MKAEENQTHCELLKAEHTRQQANQRLQAAINCLQRNMYSMECLLEKLDTAKDDAERARVMNSVINHLVTGIQPNLRIDLLADSQSELAKLGA